MSDDYVTKMLRERFQAQHVMHRRSAPRVLYIDLWKERENKALLLFDICNKLLIRSLRSKSWHPDQRWCFVCHTVMCDTEKPKRKGWIQIVRAQSGTSCDRLCVYCRDCVPIELTEPVPDPINPFVPYEPLFCLCSTSRWEVNVKLHRDTDHTDVPFHLQAHTHPHTDIYTPRHSTNVGTVT